MFRFRICFPSSKSTISNIQVKECAVSVYSELLDGLRALGSIASLTSPAVFDNFLKPIGQK
jgi:hypothetical protein